MQSNQKMHHIDVEYNGRSFPLYLRLQDISMLYQVWMDQSYHITEDEIGHGVILDLGSHIGFTSLYLWTKLNKNHLFVCVEGSNKNVMLLEQNLQSITQHKIIQQIITSDGRNVNFYDEVAGHLHQVHESLGNNQESKSIQKIIDDEEIQGISLCKMDIEGMEDEILTNNNQWLTKVDILLLELHKGSDQDNLKEKMKSYGFNWHSKNGIIEAKRNK